MACSSRINRRGIIFVLDTNVPISKPGCLDGTQKLISHIVIPFGVLYELREIGKEKETRRSYNARLFLKKLNILFDGDLTGSIELIGGGATLSIGEKQDPHPELLIRHGRKNSDFWILNSVFWEMKNNPHAKVILKTADKKLIDRANKFGICAEFYDGLKKRYKKSPYSLRRLNIFALKHP